VQRHRIIITGASAGGVEAVTQLFAGLRGDLPAALFVVIHQCAHGPSLLHEIIGRRTALTVVAATDGMAIEPSRVYVAPPDRHLLVAPGHCILGLGPRENHARPAVDPLFRSAAESYGSLVIGVVLSGNLDDGAAGLRVIQKHGGVTVVQEPADAPYPGMPHAALRAGPIDHIVPLEQMPMLIEALINLPVEHSAAARPAGSGCRTW